MIGNDRKRRSRSLVVEGLESRRLLNGAVPSLSAAEVHSLRTSSTTIKGVIHAQVTSQIPLTSDGLTVLVNYTGTGTASLVGSGQITGQHTVTSVPGRVSTNDTYSNGSATLSGSGGDVIDATYTGTGHTIRKTGKLTATLRGSATDVAGVGAGLSGTFSASVSGSARTGAFTITFTIKV